MIDDRFGHIIYEPFEILFAKCLHDANPFFADIKKYLYSVCEDNEFIEEITDFQSFIMNVPGKIKEEKDFGYDFATFFNDFFSGNEDAILEKNHTLVSVQSCMKMSNWADYVREVVWYSSRMSNSTVCEFK